MIFMGPSNSGHSMILFCVSDLFISSYYTSFQDSYCVQQNFFLETFPPVTHKIIVNHKIIHKK